MQLIDGNTMFGIPGSPSPFQPHSNSLLDKRRVVSVYFKVRVSFSREFLNATEAPFSYAYGDVADSLIVVCAFY